jgi:hypothetical protein
LKHSGFALRWGKPPARKAATEYWLNKEQALLDAGLVLADSLMVPGVLGGLRRAHADSPSEQDGAAEEGSPLIQPGEALTYTYPLSRGHATVS